MFTKRNSLKMTSWLFFVWMVLIGNEKFNSIHILMKHSIYDIDMPRMAAYVVELKAED